MAIESKNHRPSDVDHVLVSQATRRDAKPVTSMRFETYEAEQQYLSLEKRQIESKLSVFKTNMSKEQMRIRDKYARASQTKSVSEWIKRRTEMEDERTKLVERKDKIERELIRLKPLVRNEKARSSQRPVRETCDSLEDFGLFRDDGTVSWDGVACQILLELQTIRKRLDQHFPEIPS